MSVLTIAVRRTTAALRRQDRVWLSLAVFFAGLAAVLPEQAGRSAAFTLDAFVRISPFLIASVILAAGLKAAGADRLIGARVSGSQIRAILLAAGAGAFSPFCSCAVVPLIAALLAAGVPIPVVMAFWVSSPLMDPEMFILMWVQLGLGFTLAKTAAAFGLGLAAGLATLAAQGAGWFTAPLRAGLGRAGCGSGGCESDLPGPVAPRWAFWREPERWATFTAESRVMGLFLAKWLLLAFALESLMVAWLPPETVVAYLGGGDAWAIPLAVIVGVPAYLNGFAAIPLVGELMALGMDPGAALAFLVAGGVTSLPAAMAVFALVKRSLFLWYLAVALLGSLAVGAGYQAWLAL